MMVDGRVYTGKNAREEAGTALIKAIMASLWEGSKHQGHYKGFTIMTSVNSREGGTPRLYLRGKQTYEANLNSENALGTIASIEYALRRLDNFAEQDKAEIERMEKALADYREQLNIPFEYEEQLRSLFIKQQEINRQLDLDKSDTQVAVDAPSHEERNDDTVHETLPTRRGTFEQGAEEGQLTLRRTTVMSDDVLEEPART